MATLTDMGRTQQNTADNFVDVSATKQVLKKNSETLHTIEGPMIVKTRDVAGSTLWDINFWDAEDSKWNETYSQGFFLDSATLGVLGTNVLGPAGTAVLKYVVNPDNRYYTLFTEDQFEDTSATTATWGPSGLVFTSSAATLAQSLECAYSDGTIFRATLNVEGTNTSGGEYFLSANGGSSWEEVTPGIAHDFTNTGTDLRFRIDNWQDEVGWPTPFETWAEAEPVDLTLTKLTIDYEV